MKTTMLKTNLQPHFLMSSVTIVIIVDMSTTTASSTNATIVMSTHLDIQFWTATTLIIVEAGVFNHSKGVMLRWPHFCCTILFSNMQHPHVCYPMGHDMSPLIANSCLHTICHPRSCLMYSTRRPLCYQVFFLGPPCILLPHVRQMFPSI